MGVGGRAPRAHNSVRHKYVQRCVQACTGGGLCHSLTPCECPRCEAGLSTWAAVLLPPSRCEHLNVGVTTLAVC